ncbi:response regulator [Magnetovibrio blakemorei]|uniref:Response regulator n=1 Tax=Magnetovibrio blakemorei TaxID=28181 RepID=A0A1E5Q3F7_9PROT|nr:response regulator [Magnetovibrio blakemorei]OEJ64202.1 hypothetical protein BEN30_16970 [Magnetovibrio blakemorei]
MTFNRTPSKVGQIQMLPPTVKNSIIFVDDDQNILNGLRRMLHFMREQWDMVFVVSGQDALKAMEGCPVDVIVSDMRMPEMDGAQLLTQVKLLYPETVRIIFSGHSEEQLIFKTVGPAHQFIAKPSSPEIIVNILSRSIKLRSILNIKALKSLVASLEGLPTPPKNYFSLINLLEAKNSTRADIAKALSRDIALTAQTMKLTNSAYFGLPKHVENVAQAVALLGTDTIKALVLATGYFHFYTGILEVADKIELLCQRSFSIGAVARELALFEGSAPEVVDQAGSAGTLSHIGTLILIAHSYEKFKEAMEFVDNLSYSLIEAEEESFGVSHQKLGAYLLGLWGFTDPIVEAVAFHHTPQLVNVVSKCPLVFVYIAQVLLAHIDPQTGVIDQKSTGLDIDYLKNVWHQDHDNMKGRIRLWSDIVLEGHSSIRHSTRCLTPS